MDKFTFNKTTYVQNEFLEYLAGAPSYRRMANLVMVFGTQVFHDIPSSWYEKRGGKIRLALDGWNELVNRGTRVRNPKYWTSAIRSGRAIYQHDLREFFWQMPEYLKAGAKW